MNSYLFGRKQYSPICNIEEGDESSLKLKLHDGVSPMTYKKLKELGYTSDDWQNWSDDEKVEKSQAESVKGQQSQQKEKPSSTKTLQSDVPSHNEMVEYINSSKEAQDKFNDIYSKLREHMSWDEMVEMTYREMQKQSASPTSAKMPSEEANALLNHFDSADTDNMSEQDKQKLLNTLSYKAVYSPEIGVIDFVSDGSDYEQAAASLMNGNKTKGTAEIFGKQANTQLVKMTPEEYMATCIDILGNASEDDLNDEYVKARVDDLRRQLGRRKKLSPIYLDLRKDMLTQEGRHRMLALKQAGVKDVPVLVLTDPDSSESLVRENGSLKYKGFRRGYNNKREVVSSSIKGVNLSEYAQK